MALLIAGHRHQEGQSIRPPTKARISRAILTAMLMGISVVGIVLAITRRHQEIAPQQLAGTRPKPQTNTSSSEITERAKPEVKATRLPAKRQQNPTAPIQTAASVPPGPTAADVAEAVARKLAEQQKAQAQPPPPKPPCRGDNLTLCTDEDLLEWGRPLEEEIGRYFGYYQEEMSKAGALKGDDMLRAYEKAESTLADRFRDCCAEETDRYYREVTSRIGGGHEETGFLEWDHELMQPVGSREWKHASENAGSMVLEIRYELQMRMNDLNIAIKFKELHH